ETTSDCLQRLEVGSSLAAEREFAAFTECQRKAVISPETADCITGGKKSWRDFARNGGLFHEETEKNKLTKKTRSPKVLSNLITWLNGRRPATTPAKAPRARPGVELLESREVPTVDISLTNGVLTIQCVNQNNDAVVKTKDTKVVAEVSSNGLVHQGDTSAK